MLEEVLTRGFVGTNREQRLSRVDGLDATANFDIGRVVVLARFTVLATACSKIIATIRLSWTERVRRLHAMEVLLFSNCCDGVCQYEAMVRLMHGPSAIVQNQIRQTM
jgi:hypothetical protein